MNKNIVQPIRVLSRFYPSVQSETSTDYFMVQLADRNKIVKLITS